MKKTLSSILSFLAITLAILFCSGANAATFTVTNLNDAGPGSLRQAIIDANASPGPDVIIINSIFTGTITLTSGELGISGELTIVGPGADLLTISGNNVSRVFSIGGTVSISDLTISGGTSTSGSGGGGIFNGGNLTLTRVIISGNSGGSTNGGGICNAPYGTSLNLINSTVANNSAIYGGGIYTDFSTTVTLTNSILSGNYAQLQGGGITNFNGGTVNIISSTVSGNTGNYFGGGIDNRNGGTVVVTLSLISNNTSSFGGGGIINQGGLTINSTTISGNSTTTGYGGGIANSGTLTVTNATISGNSTYSCGGGISNGGSCTGTQPGSCTIDNSIVSGNSANGSSPDLVGPFTSTGYNIIGNTAGSTGFVNGVNNDAVGIDPLLGPLANNGGFSQTMALLSGSPAIDAGSCVTLFDQRGMSRPQGVTCDIGAFEKTTLCPEITVENPTLNNLSAGVYFSDNFTASGGIPPYTYTTISTLPGGVTLSSTGILSGTSSGSGTFPISVSCTDAGGCTRNNISYSLIINAQPCTQVSQSSNQEICNGGTTSVSFSGGVAGTTYNWNNNTTLIGLAASGTGDIASFNAVNNGASPVTATITVFPILNGCIGTIRSFTITVNPPITQVDQPANQVVCDGSSTAAINFSGGAAGTVYNWTASTSSLVDQSFLNQTAGTGEYNSLWQSFTAGSSGLLSQVSMLFANSGGSGTLTIYSGLGTSGTALYSGPFSVAGGWCNFPIPLIPIMSGSQYTMSFVCSSGTIWAGIGLNGTATYAGGVSSLGSNIDLVFETRITQNTGLPSTSGTGDIPSFTVSNILQGPNNTMLGPLVNTIIVTPSLNGCLGAPKTFTITVNPLSLIVPLSNQTVCNGAATAGVSFSGGEPGTTYSWTNNTTSIGLASSGNGNIASFDGINNGTSPVTATITVSQSVNACNSTLQRTFTITVNPTTQVNDPANQTLCNGAASSAVNFSGGVAGTLYSWTNNTPSIGLAAGGTGDIASFTAVNNSASPVTATITVTPTAYGCAGAAQTFTITVNPPITAIDQPANQVVCDGSSTAAINFSGGAAGTVYNWTASTSSLVDQSFLNQTAGTGEYNSLWQSFTAGSSGLLSQVSMLFANSGGSGTLTIYSGLGTSGTALYSGPFSVAGGWCNFPIPLIPIMSGSQYTMSFVCSSGTIWAGIGLNGTATYAGGVSSLGSNIDLVFETRITQNTGLPSTSGTGDIPSFTVSNILQGPNNTMLGPLVNTIIVTPSLNGCLGAPKTFTITVNPLSLIVPLSNQTVCNGAATAGVSFSGGEPGTTYSWTNNTTSIGLASSGNGNIASFDGINNGTSPVTATITVSQSVNACNSTLQRTFTITVNPTTQVNDPANQTLCNGAASSAVNFSGGVAGTLYSWTNNTPSIGLAAGGTGDIASFTAVNNSASPVTATITVTPTAYGCAGAAQTFTITVNPPITAIDQPANQVVCDGSSTAAINFSGGAAGTVYNWTASTSSLVDQSFLNQTAGTGEYNSLWQSFTAGSSGLLSQVSMLFANSGGSGTLTIYSGLGTSGTALYSGPFSVAGGWCNFPIPLIPIMSGSQYTMSFVCSSGTIWAGIGLNGTATYAGGVSSLGSNIDLVFETRITQNTGLPSTSGTGDIPSFTVSNILPGPLLNTIIVTPSLNGCLGTPKTFTITVNNYIPTVNTINDQTLCNGAATTPVSFSGGALGTVYNWTNNNIDIGLGANGTGNIAPFNTVNNGTSPATATITVTPTNGGCNGASKNFTITVNPSAQMNQPANLVLCNGASTESINFSTNNTGGTTSYSWTNNNTNIGLASSGTGDITSFNAVNNGTSPVMATVTVTSAFTNGGVTCNGTASTFMITVNPTTVVTCPDNISVCINAEPFALSGGNPSGGTYSGDGVSTGYFNPSVAGIGGHNITYSYTDANSCTNTCSFTITVNVLPTVSAGADVAICKGSSTTLTATGAVNYTWDNGAGNAASITVSPTTTTTYAVTGKDANGCANTDQVTATVNATPSITSATPGCVVGPGTGTITIVATISSGVIEYSIDNTTWQTGNVFSLLANNTYTVYVRNQVHTSCVASTTGVVVNCVIICPQVNQPANQTLCSGLTTTAVNFSGGESGTVYNWSTEMSPEFLDQSNFSVGVGTGYASEMWQSFTAGQTGNLSKVSMMFTHSTASGTLSIYSGSGTSGIVLYSRPFSVSTVGETLFDFTTDLIPVTAGQQYTMSFVCSSGQLWSGYNNPIYPGGAMYFSDHGFPIGGVQGAALVFRTFLSPVIGLAGSGTGDIASFTAVNNYPSTVTATVTVTASLNGCEGAPQTFTITVDPLSQINQPTNQTMCNGTPTTAVIFSGGVSGTTYSWTNNNTSIGLASSGTGDIASFTAINNGMVPETATITVSQSANECNSTLQKSFTITVNPSTQVNQPANQEVCNGAATTAVNLDGGPSGTIYRWVNNTPSIGLAASGSGNIGSFTAINNSLSPVIATITITPSYFVSVGNECAGIARSFTITVSPPATQVNQPDNQTLCNGLATSAVNFSGGESGTVYNWSTEMSPEFLDQSNFSVGVGTGYASEMWQSFTAGQTGNLSKVSMMFTHSTASGTLSIYSGSGTSGIVLYSRPFSVSTVGETLFDFTTDFIPVTAGQQYTMSFVCSSGQLWSGYNNPIYPGGAMYFSEHGFPIGGVQGAALVFRTFLSPVIGLAGSGTGDIASFTAINNGTSPVTANITVIPSLNGCLGAPKTFIITVSNYAPTVVTCPANISVCIDAAAFALSGGNPTGGTYSGDGVSTGYFNPSTAGVGAHTITYSYSNSNSCISTCNFTITVNALPAVTCPSSSSVCINATPFTLTGGNPTSGTYSGDGVSGGIFNPATAGLGPHTITYSYTDANSCTNSCTFTITVNGLPVMTCPSSSSVCINTTPFVLTGGNPTSGTYSGDGVSAGIFNPATAGTGPHTITYTYTDANSCTNSCMFTITVNPLPTINTPTVIQPTCAVPTGTIVVNATGSGTLEYSLNGGNWETNNSFNGLAPGNYNIAVRFQNNPTCSNTYSGNSVVLNPATVCCVITCPTNKTVNNEADKCGKYVTYPAATATGICGSGPLTYSNPSGSWFPVGTTIVTVTAPSGASCSFTVTVRDTQKPVITSSDCDDDEDELEDIQVRTSANSCNAVVNFHLHATDNCSVQSLTSSPASGSVFPLGTTLVTVTAIDASGNTSTATFNVKVKDKTDPVIISCAPPQSANANSSCKAAVPNFAANVTANDNCTATNALIITQSPAAGTLVNKGITTVTITVKDASGNTKTCTTTFTVTDITLPSITCPANISANAGINNCSKSVSVPKPSYNDNCGVTTLTWVMTGATTANSSSTGINTIGSKTFNLGVTTVTYTVKDAAGNSATSCPFTITVTGSGVPLGITCPSNKSVTADAGQCYATGVNLGTPTTKGCGTLTVSNNAPAQFNVGANTVTWSVTDGVTTKTCTQTVTVTASLSISCCPPNITVNANTGFCYATGVNLGLPSIPGCLTGLTVTNNAPASGQYPVGTTTVTWTVRQGSNTKTCTQKVIVEDNQSPVITCPADINETAVQGQCGKSIAVPNPPSKSDNCAITKQTWTMSGATSGSSPSNGINVVGTKTFKCGITTITYTVKDAAGNTGTCSFNVNLAGDPGCSGGNYRIAIGTNLNSDPEAPEVSKLEVTAFPNPTESYFNLQVRSQSKETVEIRMYDMLGKVVEMDRGAPDKTYRFGDHSMSGMYLIEVRQAGQKAMIKVVKQ